MPDNFNDENERAYNGGIDDIFREMLGNMRYNEPFDDNVEKHYMVNGKEVDPKQFSKINEHGSEIPVSTGKSRRIKKGGILDQLGTDLTQEAKDGKLDPVIGRDKEIQEVGEILSRRNKNNPIIVGDAGVGKTAVVEGLAQAIVKGNVPASIKGKRIIEIDISSLSAGTGYRGSFEEKIENLLKEVKSAGNIILFFDEIHQILGAGSTGDGNGSKGLSDILKPALAKGDISVIGSTTEDEYHNSIEKDPALARRFNSVKVSQPSKDTTFLILKGIRNLYEKHHNVKLPDSVLREAIELSDRYIPNRSLPDKAIDLIDSTAAHLAAKHPVIEESKLEDEKKQLEEEKAEAVKTEDYKKAQETSDKISKIDNQLNKKTHPEMATATTDDVAQSIERLTGVPASRITTSDITRLSTLGSKLKKVVIGQDEAVDDIVNSIVRNRTGFGNKNRPTSFLFAGKTGTGKTFLAKQLAKEIFGSETSMIRLDMSEFSDKTALNKLIGAPAGYIGYGEDSHSLAEQVKRNPYSLVLLDEIEKADDQVITALLSVLDDGRLTEGNGNTINFKNTIIIATSNAGFGQVEHKNDESIMDILKGYFRPEFLNRFDAVVRFNDLSNDDLRKIVVNGLEDRKQSFKYDHDIDMTYTDKVVDYLLTHGITKDFGARPLRRLLDQQINGQAANLTLKVRKLNNINFDVDKDKIVAEVNQKKT